MPPAALPGAKLLPDLIKSGFDKQVFMSEPDKFMFEGGCDLTRGTRDKTHPQPAFKVFLHSVASPPLPPEAFFGAE